jgi:hypothetical protein
MVACSEIDSDGATVPVVADVASVEPSVFFAVTTTRSDLPMSAAVETGVVPTAPATVEQLFPLGLQRRHWYVNVIGPVPVHAPGSAVRVWPSWAVPEIVGGLAFCGRTDAKTPIAARRMSTLRIVRGHPRSSISWRFPQRVTDDSESQSFDTSYYGRKTL